MPVQADAVDTPGIGPVTSFLPPRPNIVAQALLNDPTLRNLRAEQLAAILHVSVSDARDGIGSIIGMINRTAMGHPDTALRVEPSLGRAIGPFMSLDQAMSRFGSHMGPIVTNPQPSPMWRPDYPPDREIGAGRTSAAPRGRGHSMIQAHWSDLDFGEAGASDWGEAGDAATDQQNADAIAMNNSLSDHGYKVADQYLYKAFQTDVGLTPDGFPGTKTMQELKDVLFALGIQIADVPVYPWSRSGAYDGVNAPLWSDWAPGQSAPSAAAPATPTAQQGTYTAPTTTITPSSQVAHASMLDSPWTWVAIGAAVVAATISHSKHPPAWARKIGLVAHHHHHR